MLLARAGCGTRTGGAGRSATIGSPVGTVPPPLGAAAATMAGSGSGSGAGMNAGRRAGEHLSGQGTQVPLLDDLLPDPLTVTQDPFDNQQSVPRRALHQSSTVLDAGTLLRSRPSRCTLWAVTDPQVRASDADRQR